MQGQEHGLKSKEFSDGQDGCARWQRKTAVRNHSVNITVHVSCVVYW